MKLISTLAVCYAMFQIASSTAADAPKVPLPPALVGKSWVAEDIDGKGVIDNARTYVRFDSLDKVSGSGGANRFSGPCKFDGNQLTFGELVSTKRAGVPALMNQEAAFFKALAATRRFEIDENGLLHFFDKDGRKILRLALEAEP